MLSKIVLVIYLITGRSEVQISYVARFATEQQCESEAAKYQRTNWQAYPIKAAQCVFDITKEK